MGKLIFITGGARSGKSTFAEKLAAGRLGADQLVTAQSAIWKPIAQQSEKKQTATGEQITQKPAGQQPVEQQREAQQSTLLQNVLYIATAVPFDDEMELRIQKHKERRPAKWETVEAYRDLDKVIEMNIDGKSAVLLDCITVMITNLMVERNLDWDRMRTEELYNIETEIDSEIKKFIDTTKNKEALFIVVSNEIGMGLVPEYAMSRVFRDIAGRINQKLAEAADEVFFCVSGIPVKIK